MVTRPDLAVSYLIAVGAAFLGLCSLAILYPSDGPILDATVVFAIGCGLLIACGFLFTGLVLGRDRLRGARAVRIAIWGTAGLGLPSVAILVLRATKGLAFAGLGWRQVVMLSIAGGGIVGILFGTLFELKTSHTRTWRLNKRNTVYLRLFRHDIRNSITVLQGHVELLANDAVAPDEALPIMREQLDHILRLSEAAQTLDDLEEITHRGPLNFTALVNEEIARLREHHTDVEVHTDIADQIFVEGNSVLAAVVENLLRNAVEHHPAAPTITVRLHRDPRKEEPITLVVEDDGEGFTEEELELYEKGFETELHHSDGVGLWLSQWIVNSFDGVLTIENEDIGSRVTVRLPAASPEGPTRRPLGALDRPAVGT